MMVGHTHNQVDWCFGLINRSISKRQMVLTLDALFMAAREALKHENLQSMYK